MMGHRCSVLVGTFALASFFLAGAARAQDWPTRPVTMVVPYAAGGPVDTVGRIMAVGLSEILRQQVVIENVTGAGGMTGTSRVALAAPDGYTFLLGGLAVLGLVPNLYKKPLYNPVTDFASVSLFADSARILIVRKDLPADTLKDFIAYAQTNQAKMQFGSAGAPELMRCSKQPRHSITSSARPSNEGGTVSPRALAVLRLITSSNFTGSSIGKSAGFSPFKTFCT